MTPSVPFERYSKHNCFKQHSVWDVTYTEELGQLYFITTEDKITSFSDFYKYINSQEPKWS